ncbi:MAG: hypothetical protein A4S09_00560 [Proteobacteria bacterium SG_bin7]|nr:MAG: hypothetical protein A4S09_00560 [Proteobacteria bacterium SG_bin7]
MSQMQEPEKSSSNSQQILWVSPSPPKNRSVVYYSDIHTAMAGSKSIKPWVTVVDSGIGQKETVELLSFFKLRMPAVARVVKTDSDDVEFLRQLVNDVGVFCCIDADIKGEKENFILDKAIEKYRETSSRQKILADITSQNKRLEELTQNLEFLVEERTKSIESSKDEVAKKLRSLRQLVAFIKELSLSSIVDDWLLNIGSDVREFHGVGVPFLAFTPPNGTRRVITFRGKDLVEVEVEVSNVIGEMRSNNRDDQKFLANLFQRPIASVVAVPLGKETYSPVLYFEHSLSGASLIEFTDFLHQRLQPMMLSLDRILIEQQTRYASKQWELTFDSLQDPVSIIDLEYNVIRSNKSFYNLKQKNSCYQIFASRTNKCQGCPVEKAMMAGSSQSGRIHIKNKMFEVFSFPVGNPPTNFINYYADITNERKLFSRLVQNEKMAALGSLAGNIAHELNNPLTGIRSLAQLLQVEADKYNKADFKNDLVEIEKATERSHKTVKNLLEFSRPTSLQDSEVVSINEVIDRTLPMLKTALRDHRSEVDLSDEKLNVKVNLQLLQQVVFNIVLNACQAMSEPGQIEISTHLIKSHKGADAEIWVRDTGHGIAKEDLEHVFEPFFTTKEMGQGTGIGLSMSKSIIERFGGKIFIESKPGTGTTVKVRLPLA